MTVGSKTFKTANLFYSDELVDIGIEPIVGVYVCKRKGNLRLVGGSDGPGDSDLLI